MIKNWKILPLVTMLTVSLLLVACGGAPAPTTPAPTTPAPTTPAPTPTIDTASLFASKCAACHGANRQGVTGLGGVLTPQSLEDRSVAELANIITNGKTGTAMPPFKQILSQAEIDALAQFIKNTPP